MSSFVRGWKTTISSKRFKNSGLNFEPSVWLTSFFSVASSSRVRLGFSAQNSSTVCEPKFEVKIISVFFKDTVRPLASDKIPSSKICN